MTVIDHYIARTQGKRLIVRMQRSAPADRPAYRHANDNEAVQRPSQQPSISLSPIRGLGPIP